MILAAGRGERMRPLTDHRPKPLLEVAGRPLIEHHIRRLVAAGIHELVINTGWLGEQLPAALGDGAALGASIAWSSEPPEALETAGGVIRALPLLGSEPFLLLNADIWCDADLARLPGLPDGCAGALLLVDNPEHNPDGDFALAPDGSLLARENGEAFTFAGLSVLRPSLFAQLAPGRRALKPVLDAAITRSELRGWRHRGLWVDVGTPARLAELERELARAPGKL